MKKHNLPTSNIKELKKAFDGKLGLMLFYLTWIKNGLNATKAYKELHPEVDDHSARTLGSRLLARVDIGLLAQAYGLDHQTYFKQLKAGLQAIKSDITGNIYPDHRTRAIYMDKLERLLGIVPDETVGLEFKNGEKSFRIVVTRGNATGAAQ